MPFTESDFTRIPYSGPPDQRSIKPSHINQFIDALKQVPTVAEAAPSIELTADVNVLTAQVFDPSDPAYGAVRSTSAPSGAVMSANVTAIQAAADAAAAAGGLLVIKGTYFVNARVTFRCHVDARTGILRTTSTALSPVVRAGSVTSGDFVTDLVMHLPQVFGDGKAALGNGTWGSDTGVELGNLFNCSLYVSQVQGFGTGVHITAVGTGFSYNEVTFAHIRNNKVNLHIEPGTGGYCNEVNAYGGRFSHLSAEGSNITGARHIKVSANGANAVNNWRFHKPSIEGNGPEYHLDLTELLYSIFDQARYESTPPKALMTNCNGVVYFEGYNLGALVITNSGSINGKMVTKDWTRIISGGGAPGVLRLANSSGAATPAITIGPTGSTPATDFSTEYTVAISANTTKYKATADATSVERLTITHATGALKWQDVDLSRPAANVLALGADDSFKTGRNVTASRPSASTAGAGSMFYDTTLSKPIWSDGTTWRDAAGTAV